MAYILRDKKPPVKCKFNGCDVSTKSPVNLCSKHKNLIIYRDKIKKEKLAQDESPLTKIIVSWMKNNKIGKINKYKRIKNVNR